MSKLSDFQMVVMARGSSQFGFYLMFDNLTNSLSIYCIFTCYIAYFTKMIYRTRSYRDSAVYGILVSASKLVSNRTRTTIHGFGCDPDPPPCLR